MTGRLGLGLAALGRPAYITSGRADDLGTARSVDELRAQTGRVLDAAYDAGVRYVDCARSYGRAEEFLADWLAARPGIDDVTIASKWGYRYVGQWRTDADVHEVKDHSAAAFTEQLAQTRELLGARVAVYQVHSLMPDDPLFDDAVALGALARLRDTGVRVGFSTSGPAQADTVRRALAVSVGGPVFDLVQSTWNVLETSVGEALREAASADLDIVVKEGMANGRLMSGTILSDIANNHGVGPDAVALAAVLAQPWRPRVLSGAVTVEQLLGNLAAADVTLSGGELERLASLAEAPEAYWSARSQRSWA